MAPSHILGLIMVRTSSVSVATRWRRADRRAKRLPLGELAGAPLCYHAAAPSQPNETRACVARCCCAKLCAAGSSGRHANGRGHQAQAERTVPLQPRCSPATCPHPPCGHAFWWRLVVEAADRAASGMSRLGATSCDAESGEHTADGLIQPSCICSKTVI